MTRLPGVPSQPATLPARAAVRIVSTWLSAFDQHRRRTAGRKSVLRAKEGRRTDKRAWTKPRRPTRGRAPAGRSAAGQSLAALPRPTPRPRHGLLARQPDAGGGLGRLQLGHVRRYRDQHGQARHIRRALAPRGVLHPRRQGAVGHGPGRGLRGGDRPEDLPRDPAHPALERARDER